MLTQVKYFAAERLLMMELAALRSPFRCAMWSGDAGDCTSRHRK